MTDDQTLVVARVKISSPASRTTRFGRNRCHAAVVDRAFPQQARAALHGLPHHARQRPVGPVATWSVAPNTATVGTSKPTRCACPRSRSSDKYSHAAASSMNSL